MCRCIVLARESLMPGRGHGTHSQKTSLPCAAGERCQGRALRGQEIIIFENCDVFKS